MPEKQKKRYPKQVQNLHICWDECCTSTLTCVFRFFLVYFINRHSRNKQIPIETLHQQYAPMLFAPTLFAHIVNEYYNEHNYQANNHPITHKTSTKLLC